MEIWIKKRFSRCDDSYNPGQIVKSSELTCEQQCEESQCIDHVLLPNPGDAIKRLCRALQMDERSSHITHLMPSFQIRWDILTWNEDSQEAKNARKIVINVYQEILRLVSVTMCGENAAKRSVERAVQVISLQLNDTSANFRFDNALTKVMSAGLS